MNATGRTERAGRIGQMYGNLVKRLCTVGWALTGLIVAAMLIQRSTELTDPEHAFGYACLELLGPGLVGLMVSCVLAANMSTCSNFMVNTGALFTRNLYAHYIRPAAGDRELLRMGRVSGLGLTGLGILFALTVDRVLDAFLFTETIAAFMGIMFLGGILWKRANRYGALTATIATFVVYYALNYLMTCHGGPTDAPSSTLSEAWVRLMKAARADALWDFLRNGDLRLVYKWTPGTYGWATLVGFSLFVIVSLLTRPEKRERIERFFDRMRYTSDEEGKLAVKRGQDLLLVDLPGWLNRERWHNFFRRYREDVVGFILGWVAVGALILLAWGILQIGQ